MTQIDPTETFRQEAQDVLEQLEQTLLDLGSSLDDSELIDSAFRALHTIKGSGAMFGFTEVAEFVHEFESAFDRVRKEIVAPSNALVNVSLDAKDHIANLIAEPKIHTASGAQILRRLRTVVGTDIPESYTETLNQDSPKNVTEKITLNKGWRINFNLPGDCLSFGANPYLLLGELRDLGDCKVRGYAKSMPSIETLNPECCFLSWNVTLISDCSIDRVEDVFLFVRDEIDLDIIQILPEVEEMVDATAVANLEVNSSSASSTRKTEIQNNPAHGNLSLRVAAERLDELLDHVGELVIAQARLSQISEESRDSRLMGVTEDIERLSAGLRDITMGIRMVPIGTLFNRFRRLVHDLSAELGKNVEFATSGEHTELDKTVIESLADPLVHIIRNAIDHGLEDPQCRVVAEKHKYGTVRISAAHEGAEVTISVSDDGSGLDAERIRKKAEEMGLIPSDSVLSEIELYQLIFHPGFSTAQEVTSVSGRGVGMDVVSRTIDNLRGRIDVTSRPNNGTTVTLRLPLTLAIIDGMLVRVGDNRYSIPLSAVEECVELPTEISENPRGRNFLSIRGELVPFLRLREIFNTKGLDELHQKVVIVSAGEQRMGLVVDQILGNTQTVIKSLSPLHADIETFAGATIMGDGAVALILDVVQLMRSAQHLERRLRNENDGEAA